MGNRTLIDWVQKALQRQLKARWGLQSEPDELAFLRMIVPTTSADSLLDQEYVWVEQTTAAAGVANSQSTFNYQVPEGEYWLVRGVFTNTPFTGAVHQNATAGIGPLNSTTPNTQGYGIYAQDLSTSIFPKASGQWFSPPMVISPGNFLIFGWVQPDAVVRSWSSAFLRLIVPLR